MKNLLVTILASLALSQTFFVVGEGYVAGSENYRIQKDSINFAGGLSNSATFKMEDTVGEVATGESNSATYKIKAGYQSMEEVYLAISAPADLILSPNINKSIGGAANGSAVWNVTTDSWAGYTLSIAASTDPALKSSDDSFANYSADSGVDYNWSISSTASEFGMSPEGSHITSTFKDNGLICGVGSSDSVERCWAAIPTGGTIIASSALGNHPTGTQTMVRFKAEAGNETQQTQKVGTYEAEITVTALAL